MPVVTLNVSAAGPAVSAGADTTLRLTVSIRGLPLMAMPVLSTPASEIVPVYLPAASAADVTLIVKVVARLVAIVAEAGVTASQPLPLAIVTVGVIVTLPEQLPIMPIVKLFV